MTYRVRFIERTFNALMKGLIRMGVGPRMTYILSVPGRKTGNVHSTPVTLVEEGGQRWLVAPYGVVDWVKNARAASKVGLRRGRKSEIVPVTELEPEAAAPVLKMYIERVPHPRPYFDNPSDAPAEAFVAEAHRHPVFLLG
jgi:deazaflavin-dependent oxidoreductase (nitroreductase family)